MILRIAVLRLSKKGKIELNKGCKVHSSAENVFHVVKPEREYIFNCIDVPASKWVEKIKSIM